MTDNENALIAYAILDEVNEMVTVGGDPAVIARDIARAQVYATLAAVPKPAADHTAIREAISGALEAAGTPVGTADAWEAADAVMRLL